MAAKNNNQKYEKLSDTLKLRLILPHWPVVYDTIQKCQDHKRQRKTKDCSKLQETEKPWPLNATWELGCWVWKRKSGGPLVTLDKICWLVSSIIVNVNFLIFLIVPWLDKMLTFGKAVRSAYRNFVYCFYHFKKSLNLFQNQS